MATNPLEMSDEDFLNQPGPPAGDEKTPENADQQQEDQDNQEDKKPDSEAASEEDNADDDAAKKAADAEADKEDDKPEGDKGKEPEKKPEAKPEGEEKSKTDGEADVEPKKEDTPSGSKDGEAAPINYENFYKDMMAPFKANGKNIELKSPEEARQLMQMGANYTRKMQDLAPARKIMATLQNHGLLDESKLNFLISLDKGDPEAIKKLIVDKGIDPLDIDKDEKPAYQERDHQASNQEVAFRTQMEEVGSSDTGKETLRLINEWDPASQEVLWQNPEIMAVIHEQRNLGTYDLITAEMDRQKTLGQLSQSMPFIQAYKNIGDQLAEAGAFKHLDKQSEGEKKQEEKPAGQILAERAAEPKPKVDNGDQAGAAAPSRSGPGKAREVTNFLAMSDDEFLKAEPFKGRV